MGALLMKRAPARPPGDTEPAQQASVWMLTPLQLLGPSLPHIQPRRWTNNSESELLQLLLQKTVGPTRPVSL